LNGLFVRLGTAHGEKRYGARGGLFTLVSLQLLSAFTVLMVECFELDGLESLCWRFERVDENRRDLPCSFVVLNFYVVSQLVPSDFNALFFALEAFCSGFDSPVILSGDLNAHLVTCASTVPCAQDRDFREFAVRMEDAGFSFFPSGPALHKPTFISDRGCTVIDYVFIHGVAGKGFGLDHLTEKGHRGLYLKLEWPGATRHVLHPRTSQRRHFKSSPPPNLLSCLAEGLGLNSASDFLKCGLTYIFSLLVLTLGSLFTVSRPPGPDSEGEAWFRYLSRAELNPLRVLECEVAALSSVARVGSPPVGYTAKVAEL
jgi:hypothetical protein